MERGSEPGLDRARSAPSEEIPALLHDHREEFLLALLENPTFDESHLLILLERKDLSETLLEGIAGRRQWLRNYRVRRSLIFHPHVPRLAALRLVRELYLMDLVQLSLLPSASAELRRLAEDIVIARLPQLALGQKITLARRGSARIAGALLAEGHLQVVPAVLDGAFLTEAQVLRALARPGLPARVVAIIAEHRKWSLSYNVRLALVRHPHAPLARVLAFLPHLTAGDLAVLCEATSLPASLRQYIRREIAQRSSSGGER